MDKISVTDDTLQNAYNILQRLNDSSDQITDNCVSFLNSQLSNVDSVFKKSVEKYIECIIALKEKLKYCIDENMVAVRDRLNKVPNYEGQSYKKRNIGF